MLPNFTDSQQAAVLHTEPVLPVNNVAETVAYWHEVLGFPNKWTWGDPPNHGGVSWHGAAFIQFSLNPKLAAVSEGHSVWIRVRHLEKLYELHREKANIVVPVTLRPWGFSEYTVKDINGYYATFSAPADDRNKKSSEMPDNIRITNRTPSPSEHNYLMAAVGWITSKDDADTTSLLQAAVTGIVAENISTGEIIGCALLFGDNISFYYIKDVIVHPDWQGKRIGTALMQRITQWLENNAPNYATAGLFTGDHLASFYRQFGFTQVCGMYRQIIR
jgi:GNAT superfamily N-acetyltransferase